jgi:predicted dehydrogenase
MNQLKTAVVGAGFIGPVHVEALRRLGITVTGILGCDDNESQSAKEALGLPKAYGSIEELLADETVDAVHLAVPNVLHYEFSKKALQAGKHVMCEKPLAMNSDETAELAELAKSSNVAAAVCYNIRYYPMNLQARAMAAQGDLGEIYAINGCYIQDWMLYDTDYNWRVLAEQGGELRAVSDIGTHWMDLVLSITGLEVDSVFADLNTVHKVRKRPTGEVETFTGKQAEEMATEPIDITTDDYGCILFRFTNGARGSLNVSQINAGRKNTLRYEIAGAKCSVAFNSETPNDLWIGYRGKPNELFTRDPSQLAELPSGFTNYPGGHNEGFPDAFKQCFRSFYQYIAAGDFSATPLFPTFAEGHREVILCEAILESHRQEKWVKI